MRALQALDVEADVRKNIKRLLKRHIKCCTKNFKLNKSNLKLKLKL